MVHHDAKLLSFTLELTFLRLRCCESWWHVVKSPEVAHKVKSASLYAQLLWAWYFAACPTGAGLKKDGALTA